MHELSIAMSIVELAGEEASRRGVEITAVFVKLGALSGVVKEALEGSYEMATAGTPLAGSRLVIEEQPVVVFCPECASLRQLPSIQSFCCPECGRPTADVRQGRELQVTALEVSS